METWYKTKKTRCLWTQFSSKTKTSLWSLTTSTSMLVSDKSVPGWLIDWESKTAVIPERIIHSPPVTVGGGGLQQTPVNPPSVGRLRYRYRTAINEIGCHRRRCLISRRVVAQLSRSRVVDDVTIAEPEVAPLITTTVSRPDSLSPFSSPLL